jgi:hypothetical protein
LDAGVFAMICIEQEPFNLEVAAEMLPLAQKCWEESTAFKKDTCAYYGERDFQIEPDTQGYQQLADMGLVVLITLRSDGVLKGYVLGLLYKSKHHKKIACSISDSAYLEPQCRSYAGVMIDKFGTAMKAEKVEIIGWPTHIDGPWFAVLKARGYVGDDIVMEKRL